MVSVDVDAVTGENKEHAVMESSRDTLELPADAVDDDDGEVLGVLNTGTDLDDHNNSTEEANPQKTLSASTV